MKGEMRIGLFTDTYRPSINGIVFVVESLKKHLEDAGHEVYIFCPARSIRPSENYDDDPRIIRFPSVKGGFYEEYDTSFFFPPRVLSKIKELDLDVIHFFTPGQVGIMGIYAAHKTNTPLVAQHCTDLRQYVEHYRDGMLLPGLLMLISLLPFAMKVNGRDIREIMKMYRPRRESVQWNIEIVETIVTLVYSKCDAVIALSRKSKNQLESWQENSSYKYDVTLMPNGVDRLRPPTEKQLEAFRKTWNISKRDEVFGFVGRLGAEKNLDMLIPALGRVLEQRPRARLLFVGDFEYKEVLEAKANKTKYADRFTFTGPLPREELGVCYAAMDVFTFPSRTDTQGWAIHEAAMAGLPLLLVDTELSEILEPGVNGEYPKNNSKAMAEELVKLLSSPKKRKNYGEQSQRLARRFTEKHQVNKLIKLYEQTIETHTASLDV